MTILQTPAASAAHALRRFSICETPAALVQACASMWEPLDSEFEVQFSCRQAEAGGAYCLLNLSQRANEQVRSLGGVCIGDTTAAWLPMAASFRCRFRPEGRLTVAHCDHCSFAGRVAAS